jgi:hypothetical protein
MIRLLESIRSATTPVLFALVCMVLVSCGRQIDTVDPTDPRAAEKLSLSSDELTAILHLASQEEGYVVKDLGRVAESLVEVRFKNPTDHTGDQGGAILRYEKSGGSWNKRTDYRGIWVVSHGS